MVLRGDVGGEAPTAQGTRGRLSRCSGRTLWRALVYHSGCARLECDGRPRPPLSLTAHAATREGAERNWL